MRTLFQKIKTYLKAKKYLLRKKRFWAILLVVIFVLLMVFKTKGIDPKLVVTDTVKKQSLAETVLATGQVTSTTDLNLSFNSTGTVRSVRVKVGDKVRAGTVLATLDQASAYATLQQARGSLLAAQARLRKIQEGATNEEIRVAELVVESAQSDLQNIKNQQATLVENARRAYMNSSLIAVGLASNPASSTEPPTISGTYTGTKETKYTIAVYPSANGGSWSAQATGGVIGSSGSLSTTTPQQLGVDGLFITFGSSFSTSVTSTWTVTIPNTQASTYVSNYNAYLASQQTRDSAITSAQSALASAQAALDLKKAKARTSDIELAEADVLAADGQVSSATALYENTLVRAPADGTITRVDVKLGELVSAQKEVIVLQDIGNLYLEANINEANIARVTIGQPVTFTLDAFDPNQTFTGHISEIDLGSTLVSGVVNYKITATIDPIDGVKPGMTANMTVEIAKKDSVLVVPSRALVTDDAFPGKKFVRVVTNTKKKTFENKEVVPDMEGDAGLIEIASGLTEGQEIVVFIQSK